MSFERFDVVRVPFPFTDRQSTTIGGYDVLIAGQASARGLTLVSRNPREFAHVDRLQVENWEADAAP